jgi:outer membrane protein TolC
MFSYLATLMLMGALPPCGPLDLDTARALAAERSDEVAIREAELASAHVDESLARALRIIPSATATLITGPSPEARGNVVESRESNRSLKGLRPFGRIDVNVVQPIYTWGRLDAASDAAAAGVKAREELVVDTTSQVQLRVTQLYWGVSLARRLLGIAADVEKALAEADRHIAKSLESEDGEVSPADRYRLDVFRGILRGREAEAQKGLELARIAMAATLGLPPARLALKDEALDPPEGDLPDAAAVLADAERQRPDLRALDQAIRARDAEVRAEQGAMKPQFFAAGLFSYGYAPNRDIQLNPWVHDDFNVFNFGAVLGLRQDLSFPMLSARAKKAAAEKAVLERQRAGLVRLVQVQVDGAVAELKAARARLAAAKSALGSGRSLFRSVGLDFAAGVIEAKSLIEAYALYVESQVGAAQAAYDLAVARGRLALVAGEPPRRGVQCELQLQ